MIINLKKYLFVGACQDLADFFIHAQDEGIIEFITGRKRGGVESEHVKKFSEAIKILRKQPLKESYKGGGNLEFALQITEDVLKTKAEVEKLSEEIRFLEAEITRVAPFGDFSFDDITTLEESGKKKLQFYCVKSSKSHAIQEAESLIYIGTEYDLDYYIGIHDEPKSYPSMIEMHFDRTASALKSHLGFVKETLHQVEAELKGYAGYLGLLREGLLEELDIHTLEDTQKSVSFPIEGAIFSIEGWIPENKIEALPNLIGKKAVFFEPIVIEKEDRVPTYMENKGTPKLGEDLVLQYDIPASTDKDPSGWVMWAFALFFAIIIADGGYGLLFLSSALFLRAKFPKLQGKKKRLLKLFLILASSSVIWGILTSSFFGIEINPSSPISKFSLMNTIAAKKAEYHMRKKDEVSKEWIEKYPALAKAKDGREMLAKAVKQKGKVKEYEMLNEFSDNILLEFSLLIGVIHISIALIRYMRKHWANIGWVLFCIGGYLYFPDTLKATSLLEFLGLVQKDVAAAVGIQLLYGGIGAALVLALIQKRLKGIGEITHMIQIFGDILSYLRLYALALASTIVARTFNEMGVNIGLVIGSVVIVAGHSINLLLGTMGGVVHGLRLNFIEWYHYCFEGEGKLFNPLRKLKLTRE